MGIQKLKMITVIFILAIMTALLAGCSGKNEKQAEKKEKTVTVTDAKGKVEIPADPKGSLTSAATAISSLFSAIP